MIRKRRISWSLPLVMDACAFSLWFACLQSLEQILDRTVDTLSISSIQPSSGKIAGLDD